MVESIFQQKSKVSQGGGKPSKKKHKTNTKITKNLPKSKAAKFKKKSTVAKECLYPLPETQCSFKGITWGRSLIKKRKRRTGMGEKVGEEGKQRRARDGVGDC